jgi:hypothetical protein
MRFERTAVRINMFKGEEATRWMQVTIYSADYSLNFQACSAGPLMRQRGITILGSLVSS